MFFCKVGWKKECTRTVVHVVSIYVGNCTILLRISRSTTHVQVHICKFYEILCNFLFELVEQSKVEVCLRHILSIKRMIESSARSFCSCFLMLEARGDCCVLLTFIMYLAITHLLLWSRESNKNSTFSLLQQKKTTIIKLIE